MSLKKCTYKTRRANGEGSIYQRKNGRYEGHITIGYGKDGKPKKKYVSGRTESEVAKKLSDISGRLKSLSYDITENHNVGELMFDWLMSFKRNSVKPRTFEGNIRNFKLHIKPVIGNMKIDEVDLYVAQKVINKMLNEGKKSETVKKVKHLLNQFFEYAIDNKWISSNPINKIKIRRDEESSNSESYKALSKEGRCKFLECLNEDPSGILKPLCILLMFSGLRIGEAIALKWGDIDFDNKTLNVCRAITQVPKFDSNGKVLSRKTVIGSTKTSCSIRNIPLANYVVEELTKWKEQQIKQQVNNYDVDLISSNAYIFARDDGDIRTYSGCRQILRHFIKRHNLKNYNIHFHGLRHTFSTMLFENEENPKAIQQLLGHRDVKTTISVYNSVDNEYIRKSTDRLNKKVHEIISNDIKPKNKDKANTKVSVLDKLSDEECNTLLEELLLRRQQTNAC